MNKENYFKMFNKLTDIIKELKLMQQEMEEYYISCEETPEQSE